MWSIFTKTTWFLINSKKVLNFLQKQKVVYIERGREEGAKERERGEEEEIDKEKEGAKEREKEREMEEIEINCIK